MRQLTFTRYVAAMVVVFFHFGGSLGSDFPALRTVLRQGPAMVAYFFVLSGFILGTVYGVPGDAAARRRFWVARFARIYPVYLLGLAVTIAIFLALGARVPLPGAVLEATLLQAWVPGHIGLLNYPGWSLSVEAFFYASFPFLAWALFRIRRTGVMVGTSIAFWLATWIACEAGAKLGPQTSLFSDVLHYNPLLHASSFVLGVAVAMVLKRRGGSLATMPGSARSSLLAVWCGALATVVAVFLAEDWLSRTTGLDLPTDRGFLAPLFALIVAALALDTSPVAGALRAKPLVALGEASFAVYILQVPVWQVYRVTLGRIVEDPLASFLAFAVVLTAVSLAVAYGFERPARAWLRRWGDARLTPLPAPLPLLNTVPGKPP